MCLGGMTTSLLAVVLGSLLLRPFLPELARVAVVAALATFVVAGEFGLHGVVLPHRREQVPTSVIDRGSRVGALQFGYEMGTGMRTHMPSNLPYLALAAALLVADWSQAVLIGLGFGLGRAWMALGRDRSDVEWWDASWRRHAGTLVRVLTVTAVVLLTALLLTDLAAGR